MGGHLLLHVPGTRERAELLLQRRHMGRRDTGLRVLRWAWALPGTHIFLFLPFWFLLFFQRWAWALPGTRICFFFPPFFCKRRHLGWCDTGFCVLCAALLYLALGTCRYIMREREREREREGGGGGGVSV